MILPIRPEINALVEKIENFERRESFKRIEELLITENDSKLNLKENFLLIHYYLNYNKNTKKFKEIIDLFLKYKNEYNKLQEIDIELNIIYLVTEIYFSKKENYENILVIKEEIEKLIESYASQSEASNKSLVWSFILWFYIQIALYFFNNEDKEKGFFYYDEAIDKSTSLSKYYYLNIAHLNCLQFIDIKSEYQTFQLYAETYIQTAERGPVIYKALSYHFLSMIYGRRGFIKKAIEYKLIALEIITNCSLLEAKEMWVPEICNGLGVYYNQSGKFTKSIEYFELGLKNQREGTGLLHGNLGEMYLDHGNYSKAEEHLQLSLQEILSISQENYYFLGEAYFYLYKLYLKLGDKVKTNFYFIKLEEIIEKDITESMTRLRNNSWFDIAKAMMFIEKKSFKSLSSAKDLLINVVENSLNDADKIVPAIFLLLDISILEYNYFAEKEGLHEIEELFTKLSEITEEMSSVVLKIESMILRGKFELVKGNHSNFLVYLNKSKDLAVEYNITKFTDFINSEIKNFNSEIQKWQTVINDNTTVSQKLDLDNLESYISEVRNILKTD